MPTAPYVRTQPRRFEKYNLFWPVTTNLISLEIHMIRQGGQWKKKDGTLAGNGLFFHYKELERLLWPHKNWNKWSDLLLECYLKYRTIGVLGPASSGKSFCFATDALADYYCFPDETTVLCCSTTREMLEQRIWGEIKRHHAMAKEENSWLPGNIIESRQRIISDDRHAASEGRDFRNGLLGVPCKKGNDMVGLGDFAGVKNKRVRLLADELSLLPRVFVDAISNLDKNPDFKACGLGNPKDTTDALGVFCEPSAALGGWEAGLDQQPGTKTWETRRPQGICVQLPGSDSPNLDGKLGVPIITQSDIDRDVAFYGKDSLWFSMMNEGKMPRGQGSRRVLTRNMCVKNHAFDEPVWKGSERTRIAFLDAAYKGVGGDRCIYGELEFGAEVTETVEGSEIVEVLVNQKRTSPNDRQVIYLREMVPVPLVGNSKEESEEQIANFVMNRCTNSGIKPENFYYDSGMRSGLVAALSRIWSAYTVPIDCGGTASDKKVSDGIEAICKDYYYNYVTEMWFSVRYLVEAGQARGFTDEVVNEFSQREWTMVGKNKIQIEPKDKMKQKTGRSPDLADALAIGVEGARRLGFVIKAIVSTTVDSKRGNWSEDVLTRRNAFQKRTSLNYN